MKCCEYETLKKYTKYIQMVACGSVVVTGILKFILVTNITNPVYYIINIYLILLGILAIVAEFEIERIIVHFNFLRYYFGKAFLNLL